VRGRIGRSWMVIRDMDMRRFLEPTTYFSASYGLTSTAEDYLRFEQMLVRGGELFGNRLLGPRTVNMMASNHVGDLFPNDLLRGLGEGFGYTVAVMLNPDAPENRRGAAAFGWGGAFGTLSWSDPEEELTAVILLQQPDRRVHYSFENAVRQAIVD